MRLRRGSRRRSAASDISELSCISEVSSWAEKEDATTAVASHFTNVSYDRLDFDSLSVHGRDMEKQQCEEAALRIKRGKNNNKAEMIFVYGPSGCGKTKLVDVAMTTFQNAGYTFVQGKFDQQQPHRQDDEEDRIAATAASPYSAIVEAFSQLCLCVYDFSYDRERVANRIERAVGHSANILTNLIPNLRNVLTLSNNYVDETYNSDEEDSEKNSQDHTVPSAAVMTEQLQEQQQTINESSFNRIKHLLRELLRATASKDRPIIFFIDDIQWADEASRETLIHLATDPEAQNILFVAAYRYSDDDVLGDEHAAFIDTMKKHHEAKGTLTDLHLGEIGLHGVNTLVAELVAQSVDETRELAKLVYGKTNGNCFFVIQFLGLQQEEGRLLYSEEEGRWQWDVESIAKHTQLADNVAGLVISRMEKLSPLAKSVLRAAGCLGHAIDIKMIARILFAENPSQSFDQAMTTARAELYQLVKIGMLQAVSGKSYKFAHDRIQQAAYSLVPQNKSERQHFHIKIGFALYQMYEITLDTKVFFSAVDQLNLGTNDLQDESERLEIADFNLKAGLEAKRKSAFFPAASYAKHGLSLLAGTRMWTEHYELTIELHFLSAETNLGCGNVAACGRSARAIVSYCNDPVLRAKAYVILVNLMNNAGKEMEAVKLGYEGVTLLRIRLPQNPGFRQLIMELLKTRKLLRKRMRGNGLLEVPQSTDQVTIIAMALLEALGYAMYSCSNTMKATPVLVCRMAQLSLQKGICPESPMALASMATILAVVGGIDDAYELGRQAQKLAEKGFAQRNLPGTSLAVHCALNHWGRPIRESIEPLTDSYRAGMKIGEVKHALGCAMASCLIQYVAGVNLKTVAAEIRQALPLTDEFGQKSLHDVLSALKQLVHQLGGDKESYQGNPDLDVFPAGNDNIVSSRISLAFQRDLCFLFGERNKWESLTEKIGVDCPSLFMRHFMHVREKVFSALSLFDAARYHKSKRYERLGKKCLASVKKWFRSGNVNCHHWMLLLEAEQESLAKRVRVESVSELYVRATCAAASSGFFHDKALFHERAAGFYERHGDEESKKCNLEQAMELYVTWGAMKKARQMEASYPFLAPCLLIDDASSLSDSKSGKTSTRSTVTSRFSSADTQTLKHLSFDS